jgi:hypothetical protein
VQNAFPRFPPVAPSNGVANRVAARRWTARPAGVSSVQDGFDCGICGGLLQGLLEARAQSRGGGRWRVLL